MTTTPTPAGRRRPASSRLPPGLVIRPERPGDQAAIGAVLTAAFVTQPVVAALVDALRGSSAWRPDLALVAVVAEQVTGFIAATRGWVDAPDALVDVLVLSPLAVDPHQQQRGIGAALTTALLESVRADAVFLEGDPAYYARFGFRPGRPLGFDRPSARIPWPAFQVWLPEHPVTAVSGRLVYPDPFWAFDCVGLRPDPG